METKELATVVDQPISVIHQQGEILENASWMAKKLKKIIDDGGLAVDCGGKKRHVVFEGWATIARLQHEAPHSKFIKAYKDEAGNEIVEAHGWITDASGATVSEADGVVSTRENTWKGKSMSARVSMAQTRATAKALRMRHSWIMVMAGYAPTPAEEMDTPVAEEKPKAEEPPKEEIKEAKATVKESKVEPLVVPVKEPGIWRGKVDHIKAEVLPDNRPCWTVVGADGEEFKTADPAFQKTADSFDGGDNLCEVAYTVSKKTRTLILTTMKEIQE